MPALGAKQLLEHTRETTSSARVLRPVVASNDPIDVACRGLYIKTGGSFDYEDAEGNTDTMTVTDGEWVPFSPTKITAITDAVIRLVL